MSHQDDARCRHGLIRQWCSVCTGFSFKEVAKAYKAAKKQSPSNAEPTRVYAQSEAISSKNKETKKFKGPCRKCKKRDRCRTLCKKAIQYVTKDHVSQREVLYDPVPRGKRNLAVDMLHLYGSSGGYGAVGKSVSNKGWAQPVDYPFLTRRANRALNLFHFEGLSYREIAQHIHRKTRTVGTILYRARKRIDQWRSKTKEKAGEKCELVLVKKSR